MADTRRRQNRSCDPCRKGKRRCDAPANSQEFQTEASLACSNCKRWKKPCTFTWALSQAARPRQPAPRKRVTKSKNAAVLDEALTAATATAIPTPESDSYDAPPSVATFDILPSWNEGLLSHPGDLFDFNQFSIPVHVEGAGDNQVEATFPFDLGPLGTRQFDQAGHSPDKPLSPLSLQTFSHRPRSPTLAELFPELEDQPSDPQTEPVSLECGAHGGLRLSRPASPSMPNILCFTSNNTAQQYVRSTMTHNLMRIYHDSMENALSCWLTEHNCPYSEQLNHLLPTRQKQEWGPSWSNRMCIRVCRLDRVSNSLRGRVLSADEDKAAARALHLAIVAFASQWTQHAQRGARLSVPEDIAAHERAIRKNTWNEARHALQHCTGIPSFRVIFANIIFSLTQSVLDDTDAPGPGTRLNRLLENDSAPVFLEAANRQIYTFKHKFARMQRDARPRVTELRRGSVASTLTDILEAPSPSSERTQLDPILGSEEHRSTLSLMFWLGIMFDTLSAAMYQRPLVVSDEDSQISSSPSALDSDSPINLDCWKPAQTKTNADVWGDLFLRTPATPTQIDLPTRWPCSYEEAAAVLSSATPVKVLLYRRVTQLQTLLYRGASPARLDSAIQKTMHVYHHWTANYQPFMQDCVANHDLLPSRIQSWYVILDGHWHLAAMLLADVLESIDRDIGTHSDDHEQSNRKDLITTLRLDNALAVSALARSSLRSEKEQVFTPAMERHFHDSLTEVAFLVEPWTVVLIHSFAKAAYILLDCLSGEQGPLAEYLQIRQNCSYCIRALQYLGRKSDMARLVAGDLERGLQGR
ncbi:Zn(II)2Cys6 transcription factor domain-containing protein [Aspergillus mulundensis]|uniref:Regulatory protein alcR n=1 Tax=Aspergillus mulundensis TaxID=1810919 RepID=A0A3D8QRP0_9EURO|nr:Regulatory protein alcR [Aspergillus mulundensis]RDW64462.1 Regulatory protein alcR [Aspergillus mulundensis]